MKTMQVEVVSNEQNIYSGEASFVVVPTETGELGIYPQHTPIMSKVRPGVLRLQVPGQAEEVMVAISGGLLEVQPNKLTLLADVAVRSEELDEKRANQALDEAKAKLKNATDASSTAAAQAALAAAIAELKALDYLRAAHRQH